MAPRRRCPVCGSKQWHKEPSSGLITCSEGHVLQNYRNETRELTELGPHALRKRTIKSQRKRKEKLSNADPKLYHGERARFHYFQCLQLILRLQVAALAKLWNLPPEFEIACRDIWALHLSLLPNPPPAEPLHFAQEEIGGNSLKPSSTTRTPPGATDKEGDSDEDAGKAKDVAGPQVGDHASSASSQSSDDEDGDDAEEGDPELDELLRENSESSSSDEGEDEGEKDGAGSRRQRAATSEKRKRQQKKYDSPAGNVAVLMVACWTLRLPAMYMDFIRLIEEYELPYLDPLRLLPASLTLHLTKHTARALSPSYAPTTLFLHTLTSRLGKLMYAAYNVYTPEMNASPMLWRAVRALCGNPTLYILAKKTARVLSIPVMLHRSLAPPLVRIKKRDPTWHKYDSAVPEVSLVAAAIVVLKLVYGLDGQSRVPREGDDPACAFPSLSEWLAAIEEADKREMQGAERFSAKAQVSVLDMDDQTLDDYIDFCEKALLPREDQQEERDVAARLFPLSKPSQHSPTAKIHQEHGLEPPLFPATQIDSDDTSSLRPGEAIPIYNTLDVLGTLPEQYEIVVRRAAHWAGVPEDYVAGVIERFERRLVRWWDSARRRSREVA